MASNENWWEVGNSATEVDAYPSQKPAPGGEDSICPPGEKRKPTQDGWTCVPDGSGPPNTPAPGPCPPDRPYMNDGQCDKCPEGQWMHNGVCEARQMGPASESVPSSPPGSGYNPPSAPKSTKSPYDAEMANLIAEQLKRMLSGEDQPFSPGVVSKLNAGLVGSNKAQLASSQRDLQKRLIAAGLSRSGVAPSEQGRLRSRADASLSGELRNVAVTAVQSNYAAKAQALSQAQSFLNSERANALSTDQLTFAYAQLTQQWKSLQAQLAQQKWAIENGNEQDLLRLLLELQNR